MNRYEWEDFRNTQLERYNIDFTTYYTFSKLIRTVLFLLPFVVILSALSLGMFFEIAYGLGADPLGCQVAHQSDTIFRQLHMMIFH